MLECDYDFLLCRYSVVLFYVVILQHDCDPLFAFLFQYGLVLFDVLLYSDCEFLLVFFFPV